MVHSLNLLLGYIKEDLDKLRVSNLKHVNPEEYTKLKNAYLELNQKVMMNSIKNNISSESVYALKNEYAQISASFDFYMNFLGGCKEVAQYQIEKMKINLQKITSRLTFGNYEKIKKEMDVALASYQDILSSAFVSLEIQDIITRFQYQILKYDISLLIYDEKENIDALVPLILEDIERILNSSHVPDFLKDYLLKYAFDAKLIKKNMIRIMQAIVLSEKKDLTLKEMNKEVNEVLYKKGDFVVLYQGLSPDIKKDIESFNCEITEIFEKIFRSCPNKTREYISQAFINWYDWTDIYSFFVQSVITHNFTDIKYLTECFLMECSYNQDKYLILLRNKFIAHGKNYDYEITCAILSHLKDISVNTIQKYIMAIDNEILLRLIYKRGIESFFDDDFFLYVYRKDYPRFLNFVKNSQNLNLLFKFFDREKNEDVKAIIEKIIRAMPEKKQIRSIPEKFWRYFPSILANAIKLDVISKINLISDEFYISLDNWTNFLVTDTFLEREDITIKEKQNYLIDRYSRAYDPSRKYYIDKLCEYKSIDVLVELIKQNKISNWFSGIYDCITDENLKKELEEYIFTHQSFHLSFLAPEIVNYRNLEHPEIPSSIVEDSLNICEVYEVSGLIEDYPVLLPFLEKYYTYRLNWASITNRLSTYKEEEAMQILKYFYLCDKTMFLTYFSSYSNSFVKHSFAKKMVQENPVFIIDLFPYFHVEDILSLPPDTIAIFNRNYQKNLEEEGLSLSDKIHSVLSGTNYEDKKALLTYLAEEGLMSQEVMLYFDKIRHNASLTHLFWKGITQMKDPYKRVFLLFDNLSPFGDYQFLFLSEKELNDLLNSNEKEEIKNLKIKKYYHRLLQLMKEVPEDVKKRIAIEIGKSGISDYIYYIKDHYPMYIDFMVEYIRDEDIIAEILNVLDTPPTL